MSWSTTNSDFFFIFMVGPTLNCMRNNHILTDATYLDLKLIWIKTNPQHRVTFIPLAS